MPAFVKSPVDEKLWKRAKEAANKDTKVKKDSDAYWALTNSIFHKMKKAQTATTLENAAALIEE